MVLVLSADAGPRCARNLKAAEPAAGERRGRACARLSNESINKTLGRLAQMLEDAVEYGYIDRNPAMGRRRRLRMSKPNRSYLESADQIKHLLDAARELDVSARAEYRTLGRRAMLCLAAALYAIGSTPPEVMDQLGHTDPS